MGTYCYVSSILFVNNLCCYRTVYYSMFMKRLVVNYLLYTTLQYYDLYQRFNNPASDNKFVKTVNSEQSYRKVGIKRTPSKKQKNIHTFCLHRKLI